MRSKFKKFIKKIKDLFSEHPESNKETYLTHMGYAILYSFSFMCASGACLVHAFFPFLFKKVASNTSASILDSVEYREDDE
jgi:hypothetical protein